MKFVPPPTPQFGRYQVLLADPSWSYRNVRTGGSHRSGAAQKYPPMTLDEILDVGGWLDSAMARDSVCFLYVPTPLLPDGFTVLEYWGYDFKTAITWEKESRRPGLGHWFRGETEHVLFGISGKVRPFRSMVPNRFAAPVRGHSEKPVELYDHIEPAIAKYRRRLELFARVARPGWDGGGAPMADAKGTQ